MIDYIVAVTAAAWLLSPVLLAFVLDRANMPGKRRDA